MLGGCGENVEMNCEIQSGSENWRIEIAINDELNLKLILWEIVLNEKVQFAGVSERESLICRSEKQNCEFVKLSAFNSRSVLEQSVQVETWKNECSVEWQTGINWRRMMSMNEASMIGQRRMMSIGCQWCQWHWVKEWLRMTVSERMWKFKLEITICVTSDVAGWGV